MGILSDILEDSRERYGQVYDHFPDYIRTLPENSDLSPRMDECPVCGVMLIVGEMLNQHLRTHANIHVYVRVNGEIAREIAYIESPPKEFTVVVLGGEKATVEVLAPGISNVIEFMGSVSLTSTIQGFTSGTIKLKVIHANVTRRYSLYCGPIPVFSSAEIDKAAYDLLLSPLNSQSTVRYDAFQSRFLQSSAEETSRRYAAGFFDYTLAFDMLRQRKSAKDHLENALSSMAIFMTPMATTAKRVLALKMNSFELLRDAVSPSRFAVVNWFFNKTELAGILHHSAINSAPGDYGVYIDSFTELLLETLEAYRQHDFSVLDSMLSDLERLVETSDRNDRDKLTLIKARVYKRRGRVDEAKRNYELLVDNPTFEKEANDYLT